MPNICLNGYSQYVSRQRAYFRQLLEEKWGCDKEDHTICVITKDKQEFSLLEKHIEHWVDELVRPACDERGLILIPHSAKEHAAPPHLLKKHSKTFVVVLLSTIIRAKWSSQQRTSPLPVIAPVLHLPLGTLSLAGAQRAVHRHFSLNLDHPLLLRLQGRLGRDIMPQKPWYGSEKVLPPYSRMV